MNQSPEQIAMSPEDRALMEAAQTNEVQALNEYLQNRVLVLNVEVRRRDARIAELEAEVASAQNAAQQHAEPQRAAAPEGE